LVSKEAVLGILAMKYSLSLSKKSILKGKEIILEKTILILYNPFVAELKKAISNGPANTNFQFT